ncbi:hypothetical protein [Pseudogemmobacter faecipullorum]|uniref:Glycosyltransferase family 2 protein n=1 Tax=Pseudogemmobacter faecipullorum TaxID=2755041 RepID=A0ABS8CLR8_9RHOB|nr:hypothetical protein [Pseudogemmobacter faecipullorum]MCB5410160.1 hypothetical protein [Pseudogemmobacter faecipullorum]
MSPGSLSVYFIVEPPSYELMACYLAASLRQQFGPELVLIGYCPAEKLGGISPDVREVLSRLNCELRGFATEGRFDPPYPHGNKLLASLEKRETEFSCFIDSDVLCIRPNQIGNITRPGHVSLSKAASMNWAPQSIWQDIYRICRMEMPEERFRPMKQRKGAPGLPYFSSGLFSFPEHHRTSEGLSFPEVWMQVAREIDAAPEVPKKRPYLDQLSLPLAIRRAGLDWNILPDAQHFILGGRLRGEPLPEGEEIFTVHYRQWELLKEVGLARQAKDMLERHAGVRRIAQVRRRGL